MKNFMTPSELRELTNTVEHKTYDDGATLFTISVEDQVEVLDHTVAKRPMTFVVSADGTLEEGDYTTEYREWIDYQLHTGNE